MASEDPPRAAAILCVRGPWREGRERVWQAIEVLRQGQQGPAGGNMRHDLISGVRRLLVLPSVTFEPEIHAENDRK
jgi:hypothetical protein